MSLSETIKRISSRPAPKSEESTKMQCIIPILGALGWDCFDDSQLEVEFELGHRKSKVWVDMALLGPRGRPVAFIEAKAPGQDLDLHVEQVLKYAHLGGVDICALTTGLEWWLYLPRERGLPADRRFAVLQLKSDQHEQLVDDFQTYLSREALLGSSAHKRAQEVLAAIHLTEALQAELPKVWWDMISQPDHALVELVEQRVFSKIRLRPTVDQIASVLRGSRPEILHGPIPVSASDAERSLWQLVEKHLAAQDSANLSAALSRYNKKFRVPLGLVKIFSEEVKNGWKPPFLKVLHPPTNPMPLSNRRPSGYNLWGTHYAANSSKDVYVGVATALQEQHPEEFKLLASASKQGRLAGIKISRDRLTLGSSLGSSGLFIYTNLNAKVLIRNCHTLLEHFGHSKNDLEIIFD